MSGAACRDVIVHPRFAHQLGDPPVAPAPPRQADWRALPPELLLLIASHLDKADDVLNLSAVCRDARLLASSDQVWRQLCHRRFGVPEVARDPAAAAPGFWRNLYKYNHTLFMQLVRRSSSSSPADMAAPRFGHGPLVIQMT